MGWLGTVREGDSGAGRFHEALTGGHPKGAQVNMEHAGFRARKNAMHAMDGKNDTNIEDRPMGEEGSFEYPSEVAEEKKQPLQGEKFFSGKSGREYKD